MDLRLRHYFGFAVLLLAVFCAGYGAGGDVRAQETINIFPANADSAAVKKVRDGANAGVTTDDVTCGSTGASQSLMACDVQQLVNMAGPGDTVIFNPAESGDDPNVYDDLGEVLITRNGDDSAPSAPAVKTITIRGMGSGDDMITFTGKVMFNVKTSNIVIRGFKFKDTEVPDSVTMRATYSTTTNAANKTLEYGFPGIKIVDYFVNEELTGWARTGATSVLSPARINTVGSGFPASAGNTRYKFSFSEDLYVTVVSTTPSENNKALAQLVNGQEVESPSTNTRELSATASSNSVVVASFSALNTMGTVWVDSASTETCASGGHRDNVQIRNNVFENTYLAGVRAGDHSNTGNRYLPYEAAIPGNRCSVQVEIVGNSFTNIGGNGDYLKDSEGNLQRDSNGNKIAEIGNMEAAISLSNAYSTGTGNSAKPTRVTDNTIVGGNYDAITVANTPATAKIDIMYNHIENSALNGIDIVSYSNGSLAAADITVANNRIVGVSTNRYLTAQVQSVPGHQNGYGYWGTVGYTVSPLPGDGQDFLEPVIFGCQGYDNSNHATSIQNIRKRLMPEVWKSFVPTFPFPSSGAPKSLITDDGSLAFSVVTGTGYPETTSVAAVDRIRYRADECYDIGRIRIAWQKGVTIRNNDLGYTADASIPFAGSPKNGVVVTSGGNEVKPKAITGNNIGLYGDYAVLSRGASFSVEGNYLGRIYRVSGVTGVDNNDGEPEERAVGPRDEFAMPPDEEAPELVESGDDAPAVNSAGTSLTLTFDDMLDAMSRPAPGAFTVGYGSGSTITVSTVSISGMTVTLTLVSAVRQGETITVAYTKPASGNVIKDDAGNELESFTATAVTNNSTGGAQPGTMPPPPAQTTGGDDGGCSLASTGSGVDLGALVLLLGAVSFAFGLGRKAKAE